MPAAFLKVVSGSREGLNIPLSATEPLIIGRRRGDLLLDDAMCSSTHAQVIPREDGWMLQDLGSTNGTMVDGRLVREAVLRPGAEISIGNTTLVMFVGMPGDVPAEVEVPAPVPQAPRRAVELAWLLDEELIELKGSPDRTRGNSDIIDQELRLPPGLNAVLEVVAGSDEGKVFRFTRGNITLGRKMGEVPLSDLEVSKRHAVIEVFGREVIFLRDLDSTNGTYHNGRKISVSRLHGGDTIGVGRTVLKLQISL
jgi:pSer/pThr/pTyr-binding forkhead associated (FHA) protein